MYNPPHFDDMPAADIALITDMVPLASVVAQTADGLLANHLPLLRAPAGHLIGHIALANDMHRVLTDGDAVLAIFQGAQGYISPNDYPSKAVHHCHVPTWNYEVVHMHGTIRFQHDTASKRAAVGLLTRTHERRVNGDAGWRMADAPADYMATMLDAIVALRIDVTRVVGKAKLSQNRDAVDHAGAVAGTRLRGDVDVSDRMAGRRRD